LGKANCIDPSNQGVADDKLHSIFPPIVSVKWAICHGHPNLKRNTAATDQGCFWSGVYKKIRQEQNNQHEIVFYYIYNHGHPNSKDEVRTCTLTSNISTCMGPQVSHCRLEALRVMVLTSKTNILESLFRLNLIVKLLMALNGNFLKFGELPSFRSMKLIYVLLMTDMRSEVEMRIVLNHCA